VNHRLVYNDSSHSYTLNGRRCKSATAVAKIAPDSYAIEQWRKRQVAIGMTMEPRLAERVAVDPGNRELVDQVCEDAMRAAGAHHAANRGTQRHRASELVDTGGTLLTAQQREDAVAWQRTLEHHGLEVDQEYIEGFVIWPDQGVVGRYDRIARYRGQHVILDLKSGANAVRYPQGTAVQLALYARAPLVSAEVDTAGDRSTVTSWRPPPADLDLEVGYVVLLGDDMDRGELWEVDLTHGWAGAQLALSIVDWRKARRYGEDLARPVTAASAVGERLARSSLLSSIRMARTVAELTSIWQSASAAGTWTDAATEAAQARKKQLAPAT
jgi:hypothetical protein